ncbi:hypothetical protein ANCDUO_19082, partial [Ancylostoma duodenale]
MEISFVDNAFVNQQGEVIVVNVHWQAMVSKMPWSWRIAAERSPELQSAQDEECAVADSASAMHKR